MSDALLQQKTSTEEDLKFEELSLETLEKLKDGLINEKMQPTMQKLNSYKEEYENDPLLQKFQYRIEELKKIKAEEEASAYDRLCREELEIRVKKYDELLIDIDHDVYDLFAAMQIFNENLQDTPTHDGLIYLAKKIENDLKQIHGKASEVF